MSISGHRKTLALCFARRACSELIGTPNGRIENAAFKSEAVLCGVVGAIDYDSIFKILDLKIAEYTVDLSTDNVESYEDALVVAMKKEKAAYKLYTKLGEMVESEDARNLFLALAQEEAKHKLRFEIAYDDMLKDN